MTDMTAAVQKPNLVGVTPTYTACTAADKFSAAANSRYLLHYKNGATPVATSNFKITDQTSAAQAPAGAVLAGGWADDVSVPTPMAATSEQVVWIDNTNRFRDGQGFINLVHGGTLTTVSVAIFGPF
jgi:hypothetical protein